MSGPFAWRVPGFAILSLLLACSPADEPESTAPTAATSACRGVAWDGDARRRNVVLVVNDTMRRDRVGLYGGPARTPAFDAFARAGFWFTDFSSQAPWTKPSIATLFTGLYPSQHGVLSHPHLVEPGRPGLRGTRIETDVLGEGLVTLAEVLRGAGYRTAAFVANPWMKSRFGFAQGFDEYGDAFVEGWHASGEVVSAKTLDWLAGEGARAPFFLYVHYIDSHGPYGRVAPEDLARQAARIESDTRPVPREARQALGQGVQFTDGRPLATWGGPLRVALLEVAYEKGVENFDRALGVLLEGIAKRPAADETAVLITSDHGEALYDRGWGNHGRGLFEDEVGVPFAAHMPGTATRGAVDCPAGLIDVMATLCEYLGVACPAPNFGRSFLRGANADEPEARYQVAEGVMWAPDHRSIRTERYKLLYEPRGRPGAPDPENPYSLYEVGPGSAEDRDLLAGASSSEKTRAIYEELSATLGGAVPDFDGPERAYAPLDDETRRQLEELGYLGAPSEAGD